MGQPILCPSLLMDSIWLFPKLTVRNVWTKASHSFTPSQFPAFAHLGLSKTGHCMISYVCEWSAESECNAAGADFTHSACCFSEGSEIDRSHFHNDFGTTSSNMAIIREWKQLFGRIFMHSCQGLGTLRWHFGRYALDLAEFPPTYNSYSLNFGQGKTNKIYVRMCKMKAEHSWRSVLQRITLKITKSKISCYQWLENILLVSQTKVL